ncbi:MAG: ligase-associated DNA damage response endonuclease PdeM [Acidisphaera sp.]|nr:ligase-associated DNA damage response endonuclease PdeM [Acidisphaera sp.]
MTAAPLHLAGERLLLDPAGALIWPEARLLAVADLHLEKGSSFARRGHLLPPWDTRATLDRLSLLLRRYHPRTIVALGDSFHDAAGAGRMLPGEAALLGAMTEAARFIWVTGNHDPAPPAGIAGEPTDEYRQGSLLFRHIGRGSPAEGTGEICGHHHPKASVPARGCAVTRPCFVADGRRIMLPAFGAYTGGLDVGSHAIAALFPRGGRVFLLGRDRLFSFGLGQKKARGSAPQPRWGPSAPDPMT